MSRRAAISIILSIVLAITVDCSLSQDENSMLLKFNTRFVPESADLPSYNLLLSDTSRISASDLGKTRGSTQLKNEIDEDLVAILQRPLIDSVDLFEDDSSNQYFCKQHIDNAFDQIINAKISLNEMESIESFYNNIYIINDIDINIFQLR